MLKAAMNFGNGPNAPLFLTQEEFLQKNHDLNTRLAAGSISLKEAKLLAYLLAGNIGEKAPPTAATVITSKDKTFKASELGYLEPKKPEKFTITLKAFRKNYSDEEILCAFRISMVNNPDSSVSDWYASTIANKNPMIQIQLRTLDRWLAFIEQKFGRTYVERQAHLQQVVWNWNISSTNNVTAILQACVEAKIITEEQHI